MKLSSPAFNDNDFIPDSYTCDGENCNPPLNIAQVPRLTQSLALIVNDPDAPGGDWTHWLVWNLPPITSYVLPHQLPLGAREGLNDFGNTKYDGPCPPSGTHRYQFSLYALDSVLDLSPLTGKGGLIKAMRGRIIEKTILTALFHRR